MKKALVIIGLIMALLSAIIAVTPLSKLAIFPIVIAFLCGLGILWLSKKQNSKPKSIQYIFIITVMALVLTIYKSVFTKSIVEDTEQLKQLEEETLEDSKEILEDIEFDEDL